MFETVRVRPRPTGERRGAVADATRSFCVGFAHAAEPELAGAHQAAWLDRIETEHKNIRSALRWALIAEPGDRPRPRRDDGRFWLLRGYAGEGRDWIERSISAAGDAPSTAQGAGLDGCGIDARGHRGR